MSIDESPQSLEDFVRKVRNSPVGRSVEDRAQVARLAPQNAAQALVLARGIQDAWYRCQAIVSIVEANPSPPNAKALLDESLNAAYSQEEPNRVVSVASWPMRLLVNIDQASAAVHTGKLLDVISREPHGLRRLSGLGSILAAVASKQALRAEVLPPFLETAKASHGWRTERIVDSVILLLAPFDWDVANSLLASRPVTRYTKHSRALLGRPG